jgi:hypothetical protein
VSETSFEVASSDSAVNRYVVRKLVDDIFNTGNQNRRSRDLAVHTGLSFSKVSYSGYDVTQTCLRQTISELRYSSS